MELFLKDLEHKFENDVDNTMVLYKKLITERNISAPEKYLVFKSLYSLRPKDADELLVQCRDIFTITKKDLLAQTIFLFSTDEGMSDVQRMLCAVCLYNNERIDLCNDCFVSIVQSKCSTVIKTEACFFLFLSADSRYKEISKKIVIELLSDPDFSVSQKYDLVLMFIKPITTFHQYIHERIFVPEDRLFIYDLQMFLFQQLVECKTSEIIMCAESLLQNELTSPKDREIIQNQILKHPNRGEVLDVFIRFGDLEFKNLAISELQSKKTNTIYDMDHNIHDNHISKCFISFLKDHNNKCSESPTTSVFSEVLSAFSTQQNFDKVKMSIDRILRDTSVFEGNLCLEDVFSIVWECIQKHDNEIRKTLEGRLYEELVEMSDTCTSGHCYRLINVLSGFDFNINISWEQQIQANFKGRMEAIIQTNSNEIILGMMESASPEEKEIFSNFVRFEESKIKQELRKEFKEFVEEKELDRILTTLDYVKTIQKV